MFESLLSLFGVGAGAAGAGIPALGGGAPMAALGGVKVPTQPAALGGGDPQMTMGESISELMQGGGGGYQAPAPVQAPQLNMPAAPNMFVQQQRPQWTPPQPVSSPFAMGPRANLGMGMINRRG